MKFTFDGFVWQVQIILLEGMNLTVIKTSPNGRMFSKRNTSQGPPRKVLPSLFKDSMPKQLRMKSGKMSTYLPNQICFIKKKDLFEYKAKKTTPLPSSNSNILRNEHKKNELNFGKKLQASTSIDQLTSLDVTTKSWCLYDEKLDRKLGFREHYKREIASLTKIMTVLLSIQFICTFKISLKCRVKITKTAANTQGTTANLEKNYWISLEDLLYGTMLPSGNDAAYLLSEYIGYFMYLFNEEGKAAEYYSELQTVDLTDKNTLNYVKQFVYCMNERINYMGLFNTQFSNPHGLQNALNVSSALDMMKLSLNASKNKVFRKIMNTISWECSLYQNEQFRKKVYRKWTNTNQLLQKDWQGVKTGFTNAAGGCLASLKDGIYIVVLNSSNAVTRFSDTEKIFKWYQGQKQSRGYREVKLTQSLVLKDINRDFKSFTTLDNLETDITQ